MGIGTSLGAYYESPFHHEAGIEDGVMKPGDTGDDNVLPPDEKPAPKTDKPQPVSETLSSLITGKPQNNDYGGIPPEGLTTKTGITIKPEDIDTAMNVGLAANTLPVEGGAINPMFKSLGNVDPAIQKYIDMYTQHALEETQSAIKNEKLSPKEAFIQSVENIHNQLTTSLANIRSKFISIAKEPELKGPLPPEEAASKGYTEPAYRGLRVYGEELDPLYNSKYGSMYSTSSPKLADMYSSYLSMHPGEGTPPPGTFSEGAQVMPLYINPSDYHYYDAKGAHWTQANDEAIRQARKLGKPGVTVDNVWDEPNSTHVLGSPKKIYITFAEGANTVKSRFAESFDSSSPNYMHGVGAIGIGGAATGYISQDQPDGPLGAINAHRY